MRRKTTARCRPDEGFTLVETILAMGLMAVVLSSVFGAMTLLSGQSTSMEQQAQAIDELQLAEQSIVRYVHAAACAAPGTPTCLFTTATATELKFTADINGSAPAVDVKIVPASHTLTLSYNGGPAQVLLTNLDSASAFTIPVVPWTAGSPSTTYQYDTRVGISLTLDTPSVAAKKFQTTVVDPNIEAWNMEANCQQAWLQNPQASWAGALPC